MPWNWELAGWPHFKYSRDLLIQKEREFLMEVGRAGALIQNVDLSNGKTESPSGESAVEDV